MPAPKREDLDLRMSFQQQLDTRDSGPIVLINTFSCAPEDADAFLQTWEQDSKVMKRQPGFISAQLHRGLGSSVYVNYAVWESAAHLKAAAAQPEFLAAIAASPASAVARPHLFKKVAVPGICAA